MSTTTLPVYRLKLLQPINGHDFFDYTKAHDIGFITELLPRLASPASAFLIDFTPLTTVNTIDGPIQRRYFNEYTKRRLFMLQDSLDRADFNILLQGVYSDWFGNGRPITNPFGLLFHRAKSFTTNPL